jgi:type I restriction enzyme M protein
MFTIEAVRAQHYKLDAFKWIRDEESEDMETLPAPEELITEAMEALQLALDGLTDIQALLEDDEVSGK